MKTITKTIVIGGFFGENPIKSGVITKLSEALNADVVNGGTIEELKSIDLNNYKLIIWAANVDNSEEKFIPTKPTGSAMIVTKNLYSNASRSRSDAVSRIFTYHANAVIAITKQNELYSFEVIDALNNTWVNTIDINNLATTLTELTAWTTSSIRKPTIRTTDNLDALIKATTKLAKETVKIQTRFFGNVSTRCSKLFPTLKFNDSTFLVSKRNCNKELLKRSDMVEVGIYTTPKGPQLKYKGEEKPSVDTPIQVCVYKAYPSINYMIHGHNFVKDVPYTNSYYPCGDLREVEPICDLLDKREQDFGVINLLNHGFLIFADTVENLIKVSEKIEFVEMSGNEK